LTTVSVISVTEIHSTLISVHDCRAKIKGEQRAFGTKTRCNKSKTTGSPWQFSGGSAALRPKKTDVIFSLAAPLPGVETWLVPLWEWLSALSDLRWCPEGQRRDYNLYAKDHRVYKL